MYIVCVYFVAFCFSVILAVSCSSSKQKKNEKKYCSSYSIFARAHFSSHTLFDFKKLQVSHQDLYISPYKKLSVSPCWRFAPSLPFITRSVVPAAGKKSPCLSQAFRLASNRNTLPESKGKRTVPFSVIPKILSLFPPHGGGHRSSQVGTHVRRCPRLRLLRIR